MTKRSVAFAIASVLLFVPNAMAKSEKEHQKDAFSKSVKCELAILQEFTNLTNDQLENMMDDLQPLIEEWRQKSHVAYRDIPIGPPPYAIQAAIAKSAESLVEDKSRYESYHAEMSLQGLHLHGK